MTNTVMDKSTGVAASHFAHIFVSMGAAEAGTVLAELNRAALNDLGTVEWFLTSQSNHLTVKVMASARSKIVRDWGVPMRSAANTCSALAYLAELGYRLVLGRVVRAARTGSDINLAYTDALAESEPEIRCRAAALIRSHTDKMSSRH